MTEAQVVCPEAPGEVPNPRFLPTYPECYVCGQNHPTGLRIRFFADDLGGVHAWFVPRPDQTGYEEVVHGGVISALMDELTGWTVTLRNELMSFTAELTIRFLKPVSLGKRYLASATAGQGRGRLWDAEGILKDAGGTVYARASGRYFLLSSEQTAAVSARMRHEAGDVPVFSSNGLQGAHPCSSGTSG